MSPGRQPRDPVGVALWLLFGLAAASVLALILTLTYPAN